MSDILLSLNEEQQRPVVDTEGAVLVIAGAGSGKTRVLTSRIAYLVKEKGVMPYNILAITFTNKAADEMKERLASMVEGVEDMWVSTIHSMCTKILRHNIAHLGYDKNFTIYSETDKERVIKRLYSADTSVSDDEKFVKNAKWHISNAKSLGLSPKRYLEEMQGMKDIERYCAFYADYEAELRACNALDFDDLLLKTRDLLANVEDVRNYYSEKFRYVHIDEFQDTNAIQYEIVKYLVENHGNIFAVGDDDQSIYGWRGAEIKNILGFEKDFDNAKVYKLERNYRSTKKILKLANAIIKNNTERKKKELWTENDEGVKIETYTATDETNEAMYTAVQIKNLMARGYRPSDFAVLMRINALSRAYEQEFLKYGIPYKVFGGFKFYERKEVKDLMAYFRILVNPLDTDAILRIINVPKRGIGDKTIELMVEYAKNKGVCLYDSILEADELDLPTATKSRIKSFRQMIVKLVVAAETLPLTDVLQEILTQTNYMSMFEADTEENFTKRANVGELQNSINEFAKLNSGATVSDFLSSVTLSSDIDEINEGEYVSLATIHSVKGLEFKSVFISGLEETVFPLSRATSNQSELEEERRLMYVAITRAEQRLFLTSAQSRFLFGDRQYMVKSRFLGELSDELGIRTPLQRREESASRYESRYESRYGKRDNEDFGSSSYSGMAFSNAGAKKFVEQSKPRMQNAVDKFSQFAVGKKVKHPKFGEGVIVAVKGSGEGKIADVAFKGIGVKSLSLKFAPIQLI